MRQRKIYVTGMKVDTCNILGTVEFPADYTKDMSHIFVNGERLPMYIIDMPLVFGDTICVITETDEEEYIRMLLMKRALQGEMEIRLKDFKLWGGSDA